MSLLNRKPLSIGRAQRTWRDDRVFVVATDDTYAPKQYFEHLSLLRVKVVVLPTPASSGLSSPGHVVDRLRNAFRSVSQKQQIQTGDEFWVFLDTDHHVRDRNLTGTLEALRTAHQLGFEVAISNPCFELWLLLHHKDVSTGTVFTRCAEVEQQLKETLGGYNKTSIKAEHFTLVHVRNAIRRARTLESAPNDPVGNWPQEAGSRVYRLLERVLPPVP